MDAVKLEAKWPPDRRCTIEASEFGIYKEPDDGKRRLRGADRATGCLLVVSLFAAAAVVVYFMFFDYTHPASQAAASTGPIVSYAKYVKSKQSTAAALAENRSTDGLLGTMLAVKNSENYTTTEDGPSHRTDEDDKSTVTVRHPRTYQQVTPRRRSAYSAYGPDYEYWRTAEDATADHDHLPRNGRLEYSDGIYGFNRRSDFPQLAAYRAPFPPKSVVDVMKYVTGRPTRKPNRTRPPPPPPPPPPQDHMVAQESQMRYVPIQPAEEVNRFLPDAVAPAKGDTKRFRNKFGPPVYLTPPRLALPDDFMKPPDRDSGYSTSFTGQMPPSDVATAPLQDVSASGVQAYTDVVYRSQPPLNTRYAVPDSPSPSMVPSSSSPPKRAKKKRPKAKKPISVMLDIYPMPAAHESEYEQESEEEEEENEEDNTNSQIHTSLKSNLQQSDVDDLLFRLNLISKLNEGGRRLTKSLKNEEQDVQTPIINLTTERPFKDEEEKDSDETFKWPDFEYAQESKIITNTSKNIKKHN